MKILRAVRALLITTGLLLVPWPARRGWAQLVGAPVPSGTQSDGATVVILVIAMLLIIGALVKILDLKRKREGEAVVVQAQIASCRQWLVDPPDTQVGGPAIQSVGRPVRRVWVQFGARCRTMPVPFPGDGPSTGV